MRVVPRLRDCVIYLYCYLARARARERERVTSDIAEYECMRKKQKQVDNFFPDHVSSAR